VVVLSVRPIKLQLFAKRLAVDLKNNQYTTDPKLGFALPGAPWIANGSTDDPKMYYESFIYKSSSFTVSLPQQIKHSVRLGNY
jgi:hypothetical protein